MKTKYQCKYCDKEYSDYDEAKECAVDCADEDLVKTIYLCDYCKKESWDPLEIERCEKVHEEDQDDFYTQEKLNEARAHPSQAKLEF